MLIIKPYGRSISSADEPRKIKLNNHHESMEIKKFAAGDQRILIAQWISTIDKIIRKPNQSDQEKQNKKIDLTRSISSPQNEFRKQQIEARTKLGQACWNLLQAKAIPPETFKVWSWKLHPISDQYYNFKNENLKTEKHIRGSWYDAFCGRTSVADINHDQLALAIQAHLENREICKKDGSIIAFHKKTGDHEEFNQGLIQSRAGSIAENTLHLRMEPKIIGGRLKSLAEETASPGWTSQDETLFTAQGDLAKEIFEANLTLEATGPAKRIYAPDASKLIFEHYGRQFAKDVGVKTRLEIEVQTPGLLALYDVVRTYYRVFLKNTKKGAKGTSKLSAILPKDNVALFTLIKARHNNSVVNDLVRLGRVLHYESSEGEGDDFGLSERSRFWKRELSDLAKSPYWSTDGQEDIKRTEAFVRVWRGAIATGARTAKAFADPASKAQDSEGRVGDVLDLKIGKMLSEDAIVQKRFRTHLGLLFGTKASHFELLNQQSLIFATLRLLAKLRNQAIHFRGRRSFVKKLTDSLALPQEIDSLEQVPITAVMTRLINTDITDRHARLLKILEGAKVFNFCSTSELAEFVKMLEATEPSDIVLPKMNKLLLRIENTMPSDKKGDDKPRLFAQPASNVELKAPWRSAKYVGFKQLYEGPFRRWLENVGGERLCILARAAVKRSTEAAQDINKNDKYSSLIASRAAGLPLPQNDDTLASYFDRLVGVETGEMRIQNGYESNSETAKQAMEWIQAFRCDIVAKAFRDYLIENRSKLAWVVAIGPGSNEFLPATAPKIIARPYSPENWQAYLYYVLHLVPVDDASRLLHQFRKWGVLEEKRAGKARDENIEKVKFVFELYLAMHDAKHDGVGLETAGLEKFKAFFESEADFNRVFKTQGSTDERLSATRRGLREIMRFGHLEALSAAIGENRITSTDVGELEKIEWIPAGGKATDSTIANAQLDRKKLHRRIVENLPDVSPTDYDQYVNLLETIGKHRKLANKVRLNNHTRLHRLMMRVVSRLVDFAGLWERDGYFIALALMRLNGKKPDDVLLNGMDGKFRKQGHLPEDNKDVEANFLKSLHRFHAPDARTIRNDMAHFKFMNGDDVDLTKAINEVRVLMTYDRKLKNAVAKSIKDIFAQEGLEVDWKMDSHQLKLASIRSEKITHLTKAKIPIGNAKPTEAQHSESFVAMVKQLLVPNSSSGIT
ncbi:MAG: type VI-A CRISPR-associated RNA-guided ribonuclease Cas13a [Pseudomonadota bacterium]|nr:type VI-A CRISPR-associated RNA-guided ribonuclease Cas13a [Pseudomonadota bacterium]